MDRATESIAAQAALLNELMTSVAAPEMVAAGISASVFELLSAVNASQSRETQASIARRMGITPPSLTEAIQACVKKGLLEQISNPRDARTKIVRLTVKGKTVLRRIVARIEATEANAISVLSDDEYRAAVDALKRLNVAIARRLEQTRNQKPRKSI